VAAQSKTGSQKHHADGDSEPRPHRGAPAILRRDDTACEQDQRDEGQDVAETVDETIELLPPLDVL
jgi:hypothetical protein